MNEKAATYVWLMSPARFKVASKMLSPRPEKRYALLAFLAYSGDWVSRERLAYLFWPDTTTEKAQQNLRGLLYRLRSLEWATSRWTCTGSAGPSRRT